MHNFLFFNNPSAGGGSSWISSLSIGSASYVATSRPFVDSDGNIYVCGAHDPSSDARGYIVKYNKDGQILWQRSFDGAAVNNEIFRSIAVDSSGNVFVVGAFEGSNTSAYILKLNSSGTLLWQKKFSATGAAAAWSIAIDSSNNPYIACDASVSGAGIRASIHKFDTNGNLTWSRYIDDTSSPSGIESARAVSVSSTGDVYFSGTTNFSNFSNADVFVAKYNTSGTIQWIKTFHLGTSDSVVISGLCTYSGGVYVVAQSFITGLQIESILLKLDSNGNIVWQRKITGLYYDEFGAPDIDSTGNIYIPVNIQQSSGGVYKSYIFKYDSSGALQLQRELQTSSQIKFQGIKVLNNSMHVAGTLGTTNILIAKLPTNGTKTGTYSPYTYSVSSLTDTAGNMSTSTRSMADAAATYLTFASGAGTLATTTFSQSLVTIT
jgi:hypothetical protein